MANLRIPERYQLGVSRINKLDLEAIRAIRGVLDKFVHKGRSPGASSVAIAVESVSAPGTAEEDYKKISEALVSMYVVQSSQDMPLDEFAEGIANALEELSDPELRLVPHDKQSFKEKLSILLGAETFGLISKVGDLQIEGEHVFCHARILTDVRPVFGQQIEQGPLAAVITHNLKITFHLGGRKGDHDFYVLLDSDDLSELKEVITRAEAKAKTLRGMINGKVTLFGEPE